MTDEVIENHESFGVLQISRQTCLPAMNVFGSSIKTGNPVSLSIYRAEKIRDLNRTWFFPRERLIEVYMSPSQFAEAITTLNTGSGTPVTLEYVDGERMEECPDVSQRQLFEEEFENSMSKVSKYVETILSATEKIFKKKGTVKVKDKETILNILSLLKQHIESNLPFVHKQFNRAMDKTTADAKAEVEAFVMQQKTPLEIE